MTVRRDLNDEESAILYGYLSAHFENGKLKRKTYAKAAEKYNVILSTVKRLWKRVTNRGDGVTELGAIRKKYKGRSGRPPISKEWISEQMKKVPLHQRQTIRSTAFACKMSKSALHRAIKRASVVKYRSNVKPLLTESNRLERVQFALSHIQHKLRTLPFIDMNNVVHIDEKWFFLTRIKNVYYLYPEEELPKRAVKSKRFIAKVMFLAAVARPRYDHRTNNNFDGKIGIWPFVQDVPAQRNSVNRPAGTIETKSMNVTSEVYTYFLTTKVLPAIKEKWVGRRSNPIFIQQDNARPHSRAAHKSINCAGQKDGCDIRMLHQPPSSPDLNILDLGFFNAIQSLQAQKCAVNIDDLVGAVTESFYEIIPTKLSDNFITLQSVMREILIHEGSNNFKIPHLDKSGNRKRGTEITRLYCPVNIYKKAKKYIESKE